MYTYKFICRQCLKELKPSTKRGTLLPLSTYIGLETVQFICPECNKVKTLNSNGFSDIDVLIKHTY